MGNRPIASSDQRLLNGNIQILQGMNGYLIVVTPGIPVTESAILDIGKD
jgi:hypothetical protein